MPTHFDIEILTVEQIAEQQTRWLQSKLQQVIRFRQWISNQLGYCCDCCNEWQVIRRGTKAEKKAIRAFDYYLNSIKRELNKRGEPHKYNGKPERTGTQGCESGGKQRRLYREKKAKKILESHKSIHSFYARARERE